MPHALTNTVRLVSSYIPTDEILKMLQSDLSVLNLDTLRELARIMGVRGVTRKVDIANELRHRVIELSRSPLTHQALILEAQKRNIPLVGFSYQDLRVLCGYDVIRGGGIVYIASRRSPLGTILANTEPGSHQRLSRLLRDSRAMSEWSNICTARSSERELYQALFSRAVAMTPELESSPLLYTSHSDPIGHLLLESTPGSPLRHLLLQDYDSALLQEFSRRHGTRANLVNQVTLPRPSDDIEKPLYYVRENDLVLQTLAATSPNTLARYVSIASIDISPEYIMDYSLEDFCSLPQLPDYRPQKLRDYLPEELTTLPLPVLQSFAIREGLHPHGSNVTQDIESLLENLLVAYCSPTFLQPGRVERTSQVHTGLHTPFDEVHPSQLYAYGIREGTGGLVYFERDELKGAFLASGSFSNPFNNESFSRQAIQRLLVLSLNDTTEGADAFSSCLKTLLALTAALNTEERLLVATFQNHPEVVPAFEALLEAGMYMRRWDGNLAKYPLTSAETNASDDSAVEESQHFDRVQRSLERLKATVDALPSPLARKFWNLPLRNYMRSGYYAPTNPEDGKTVYDRLDIVVQGDTPVAPMESCIRMSSGWFVFTAMYYYGKIFHENLRGLLPHQFEFIS